MIGEPILSQIRMETNTRKPSPINSALPQGMARGAVAEGHNPVVHPDPPAQSLNPLLIRLIPISITVGPVTMGGKIFCSVLGGTKARRTSIKAQQAEVPSRAPYASGQGSLVPSSATGQNPLAYIWLNAPEATVIMAKETPMTERTPLPIKNLDCISQKALYKNV